MRALARAFAHSPSCVLLIGSDGSVQYANDSFYRATSSSVADLARASLIDLGQVKTRVNPLWRALENPGGWQGQLSLTLGGRTCTGTFAITAITTAAGVCQYLLCTSDGLHPESSDGAGAYTDRPTTLVLVSDLEGQILFIDRTVPGITREQAIGSTIFEYVPAEHHERIREYIGDVAKTRRSIVYEIPSVGPYGTVLEYRTHVGPIVRDGAVVALSFSSWEISEQPAEVEDRYRVLSDAGMEGLIIHQQNTIIDANPAVCEMFGYECDDLVERTVTELFAPSSRALLKRASFYESGALHEAIGLRRGGTPFHIEVCGKNLPHSSGLATVIAVREIPQGRASRHAGRTRSARATTEAAQASKREAIDLSIRELEVLELLAQGMTNRAVAERLLVSARTVDHHVSHILGKLAVPNRTAAAMAARRKGLLR